MSTVLQILANLTPAALLAVLVLAVIGGLGYVIYLLVTQGAASRTAMAELTSNHLHELPDIAETLRRIETQQGAASAAVLLQLADVRASLSYITGKLNGK